MADEEAEAYNGGETAALLVMFMRNLNRQQDPYFSYANQLQGSAQIGSGPHFARALAAITEMNRQNPALIESAHQAIRVALTELELLRDANGNKLWGSCKFVAPMYIDMLCKEGLA